MAPQSCVMNPAQGSPPLTAPPEDRAAGGTGTDELDLSPVRRCKTKSSDLPFSVESLISDRPLGRSRRSPEPAPDCARAEETECASPRGLHRSKPEALDPGDKEASPWFQSPYASPPSECALSLLLLLLLLDWFSLVKKVSYRIHLKKKKGFKEKMK